MSFLKKWNNFYILEPQQTKDSSLKSSPDDIRVAEKFYNSFEILQGENLEQRFKD